MRVVQVDEYGGSDKLLEKEQDIPSKTNNQVLIRVKAIGVNFADIMRREGKYLESTPLPFILGYEVAGIVEKTGNQSSFKAGDRVVALLFEGGAYSEYVVVDEDKVTSIPKKISFEQAAAVPLQGLTGYYILKETARIKKDETVLVHAAAGGVGTIAIQLAKLQGAGQVIATSSNQEKLNLAKTLGADTLINYTKEHWTQEVLESTNGRGADIILEMVGGEVFHNSLKCLSPFGRMIVYGRASKKETLFDSRQLMKSNQTVSGFFAGGWKNSKENNRIIQLIFEYIMEKKLKIIIGGVYNLDEAAKVHDLIENKETQGKMILKP